MTAKPTYDQLKSRIEQLEAELASCRQTQLNENAQQDLTISLFDNILIGITVWSPEGHLLLANKNFTRLTGYKREEVISIDRWFTLVYPDPDYRSKVTSDWESCTDLDEAVRQFTVTCKDGTVKEIEFRAAFLPDGRALVTLADVTAFKTLEAQLIQSQKMEALGTLAGGIAHDYNNMLMGIHGNLSMFLLDFEGPADQLNLLKNIENYVENGVSLTQQLLSLTRGGHCQVCVADINSLLQKTAEVFRHTKKQIEFHYHLDETVSSVEIDPSQMEQVFLNLFINAWQAMPDGGSVTLKTSSVTLDGSFEAAHSIPPGNYVKISVADTGVGMDPNTKSKVFDPFFTTKQSGGGTGLGLSSTYNIVINHGGMITVDSEVGYGTIFNIYLPSSSKPIEVTCFDEGDLIKGQGTILVVDDEPMVLDAAKRMLEQLGYEALTAGTGEEAVTVYQGRKSPIRLVILDIIMPGISGLDTYRRLLELDANINVLLASGYSIDGEAEKLLQMGCKGFIQKPFSLTELSQAIHTILE